MSCSEPYAQITGTSRIYLAPVREAPPAVNVSPAGNWVLLGETDGEQTVEFAGAPTYFRVNERTGPVKAIRPEETVTVAFTLVDLTHENYARILHSLTKVNTLTSPDRKEVPFQRGFCYTEYALLMHGTADSPYGLFPSYNYFPRVISVSEPTVTRSKDGRASLACQFVVMVDYQAAAGYELGYAVAQTN